VVDLCRSDVDPQRDLGAQASPSRTRSPDPKVVAQSLVDDERMVTPPPAADERRMTPPPVTDSRTATPPHADDVGAGGAVGDVGASASPRVINIDLISARPGGMDEDLVRDQPHIDQAPKGPGTSGAQVPDSSPMILRLS
jgi:hypothetical protein